MTETEQMAQRAVEMIVQDFNKTPHRGKRNITPTDVQLFAFVRLGMDSWNGRAYVYPGDIYYHIFHDEKKRETQLNAYRLQHEHVVPDEPKKDLTVEWRK